MCFLQDTSTRGRLHRPRGVSAAAAEPQRPGEQRGRRRENPSHDGRRKRPDERRRYGDLGRSPLLQLEISINFVSIFKCVTIDHTSRSLLRAAGEQRESRPHAAGRREEHRPSPRLH